MPQSDFYIINHRKSPLLLNANNLLLEVFLTFGGN